MDVKTYEGAGFEIKYRFLTRTESTLEMRPDAIQVSKDRVFVTDIRFIVYKLYILWATALKSRYFFPLLSTCQRKDVSFIPTCIQG